MALLLYNITQLIFPSPGGWHMPSYLPPGRVEATCGASSCRRETFSKRDWKFFCRAMFDAPNITEISGPFFCINLGFLILQMVSMLMTFFIWLVPNIVALQPCLPWICFCVGYYALRLIPLPKLFNDLISKKAASICWTLTIYTFARSGWGIITRSCPVHSNTTIFADSRYLWSWYVNNNLVFCFSFSSCKDIYCSTIVNSLRMCSW